MGWKVVFSPSRNCYICIFDCYWKGFFYCQNPQQKGYIHDFAFSNFRDWIWKKFKSLFFLLLLWCILSELNGYFLWEENRAFFQFYFPQDKVATTLLLTALTFNLHFSYPIPIFLMTKPWFISYRFISTSYALFTQVCQAKCYCYTPNSFAVERSKHIARCTQFRVWEKKT